MALPLSPDPLVTVLRPSERHGRRAQAPAPRHGSDVEEMLQLVLDEGAATSSSLGWGYQRLWSTLTAATDGGKRFRPALFVVGYLAWGGDDDRSAAAVGAAIELLHTAFVVHDDVIDGDLTRRGRPNVSGSSAAQAGTAGVPAARAREYGAAAGILAGDLALAAALRTVATCPAPRPTVRRLLDLFDAVLHATAAGELADVWGSLGAEQPTLDEALLMAERKTGEYSFALPLQAAAVLAGASGRVVEAAGEVGRALGVAYQLVDDLQGAFGDPRVTGKSSLSDLRSGKQTPLVAHARTTDAWPAIAPYVGLATITEPEADVARGLLTASGSRAAVEKMAGEHVERALALARESRMPSALLAWITGMTTDILARAA
jgi:geranylgeranyl diphosphate synthase type II